MRKYLWLPLFLLATYVWAADELITDFKEESVPVLNEELRKQSKSTTAVADRVTTLENTPATAAATQAQMEAASSTTTYVSPGRSKYHPGVAKAWCRFDGTASSPITPDASYNVASIVKDSTGIYTITFTTAFSSATYAFTAVGAGAEGFAVVGPVSTSDVLAGSIKVQTRTVADATIDLSIITLVCYGDQ